MSTDALNQSIMDAIPSPVFVVDKNVRIVDFNAAAGMMTKDGGSSILHGAGGQVLHCIHTVRHEGQCGADEACDRCVIRLAVREALRGRKVVRQKSEMYLQQASGLEKKVYWVTASPFDHDGQELALLLLEDITELMELRNVLPICSHCKKIRNDREAWSNMETYFKKYWNLDFSHSVCPDCLKKHYPDYEV